MILFNYYFNNDKYLKIIYVYTTYNIFIFQKGLYFSYSIYISLLFLGYYIMLFVLYLYKLYIYCITYIRSNEMHYYYFKCRFRLINHFARFCLVVAAAGLLDDDCWIASRASLRARIARIAGLLDFARGPDNFLNSISTYYFQNKKQTNLSSLKYKKYLILPIKYF